MSALVYGRLLGERMIAPRADPPAIITGALTQSPNQTIPAWSFMRCSHSLSDSLSLERGERSRL
jgi:hypothetical protein